MNPDLAAWTPQDQPTDAVVRTIIADDERLARETLRLLLDSEASVEVVAVCDDGTQTVSAVRTCRPDLLLLDIEMPGLDGFQVLSELSPPEMPWSSLPRPMISMRFEHSKRMLSTTC